MGLKMGAGGLFRGPAAYLRSRWNLIDLALVIIGWGAAVLWLRNARHTKILRTLNVFRLLRTLRPLRFIQRLPQLKHTVETLFISIKPLTNVFFIGLVFYLVFAILGVQLFRGRFRECVSGSPSPCDVEWPCASTPLLAAANNTDCVSLGGEWKVLRYNFDNTLNALLTLFVVSSKDGWVEVMQNGVISMGDGSGTSKMAPIQILVVVYFITFLCVVGYFVLNMFVGVLVENFQLSMPLVENSLQVATPLAMPRPRTASRFRLRVFQCVTSRKFSLFITGCIVVNATLMMIEHYGQSATVTTVLYASNWLFTTVFVLEACLKIVGLGPRQYSKDGWNRLDMFVVLTSVVSLAIELMAQRLPISPAVLRVLRVLRVVRVTKALKVAKGVRSLVRTVSKSASHVANLGVLLLLVFFIAAALGIEMFGRIECSVSVQACHLADPVSTWLHGCLRHALIIV